MKLSISNIAWDSAIDEDMYQYLFEHGIEWIEIAPTRIVSDKPYENVERSLKIINSIHKTYKLRIASMQSIWFGRTENLFGTEAERDSLIRYTKKAINYAKAIGCKNLVFGCPRNRIMEDKSRYHIAVEFFLRLGEYAKDSGIVIALEPNPVIYNTNFINEHFTLI